MRPGTKPTLPIVRLMARVVETPGPLDSPCWLTNYATSKGYVMIGFEGRHLAGHRCTYEHFVGPIPDGLDIDHLCRVRACVNPAHLEPVTRVENLRRGMSPAMVAVRTDTCQRGHSLADAYVDPSGGRRCRTCISEYARVRNEANRGTCCDCEGQTTARAA